MTAVAPIPKIQVRGFSATFAGKSVIRGLDLEVFPQERLAIIGPANSGKTTFLRSLNRLNDLDPRFERSGSISSTSSMAGIPRMSWWSSRDGWPGSRAASST